MHTYSGTVFLCKSIGKKIQKFFQDNNLEIDLKYYRISLVF